MWWMMNEGGGHYCPKKTDDICGDVCGQVLYYFDPFFMFQFLGVNLSWECEES